MLELQDPRFASMSSPQPVAFGTRVRSACSLAVVRALALGLRTLQLQTGLARVTAFGWLKRLGSAVLGEVDARLVDGRSMPVDLRDFNGRMLMLFGQSDPKVIRTCHRLLRAGDVFLDIGANHGEVGLLCWARTQPGGSTHVFEPLPRLAAAIARIVRRDRLNGLAVHPYGLGSAAMEAEFCVSSAHTGRASQVTTESASDLDRQRVLIMPIAEVLQDLVGDRPLGVKIDIEGAEMDVLPSVLAWTSTRFVVFECEHLKEPRRCCDLIRAAGFDLYGLEKKVWGSRYRRIEQQWGSTYSDVVAVRPGAFRSELDGLRI